MCECIYWTNHNWFIFVLLDNLFFKCLKTVTWLRCRDAFSAKSTYIWLMIIISWMWYTILLSLMQTSWRSSKLTFATLSRSLCYLFKLPFELLYIFLVCTLRHNVSNKLLINTNMTDSNSNNSAMVVYWHKSTITIV